METLQGAVARPGRGPWRIEAEGGDTAAPRNLRKRIDLMAELLPLPGLRLLDAGCGGGEYVRALAGCGADARGVECNGEKLRGALPGALAGRIVRGDLERTAFETGSFDAALLNEVLEHVPDEDAALRELHRVLRPGGRLLVFSPNRLHPFETHGVFARRSGRRISHGTPFVPWIPLAIGRLFLRYWARNYWPAELRARLRRAGFRIERHGFVWQTFENISGHQPAWVARLRPLLRAASALAERTPLLRCLGVSQWILATRVERPAPGSAS